MQTGRQHEGNVSVVWRAMAVVLVVVALASGLASRVGAAAGTPDSEKLRGFAVTPPPEVGALSLPDVSTGGADMALRAAPGELLLVYFGYTSCPDICPTTLSDLRVALRRLGKPAHRVQTAMVTIDPDRDTAEVLDGYVGHFIRRGHHALRTDDPARLAAVADAFGAQYEVQKQADGTEEVGHSAFVYAVDDQGVVRVVWPFGTPSRGVTHDLRILLRQAGAA